MRLPILTYHGLEEASGRNGLYTLRRSQFEAQMTYLSEQNFRTISLETMVKWILGESIPPKSIVITFDDGLSSDFSIALPILKRYGFTATFFVNPGRVGKEGYVTVEELQKMKEAGMGIGSHGLDHVFLTRLEGEALRDQVAGSKKRLQELLHEPISFFSVPRGRYNRNVLASVQNAGYRLACTSDIGVNSRSTDPFRLRRWAMKRSYTLEDFVSVIEGRPRRPLVLEYVVKRSAYRILGHTLYEALRGGLLKEERA